MSVHTSGAAHVGRGGEVECGRSGGRSPNSQVCFPCFPCQPLPPRHCPLAMSRRWLGVNQWKLAFSRWQFDGQPIPLEVCVRPLTEERTKGVATRERGCPQTWRGIPIHKPPRDRPGTAPHTTCPCVGSPLSLAYAVLLWQAGWGIS